MPHNIINTQTAGVSKYEDINKNTKVIKHRVPVFDAAERRELEEQIAEELYRRDTTRILQSYDKA